MQARESLFRIFRLELPAIDFGAVSDDTRDHSQACANPGARLLNRQPQWRVEHRGVKLAGRAVRIQVGHQLAPPRVARNSGG